MIAILAGTPVADTRPACRQCRYADFDVFNFCGLSCPTWDDIRNSHTARQEAGGSTITFFRLNFAPWGSLRSGTACLVKRLGHSVPRHDPAGGQRLRGLARLGLPHAGADEPVWSWSGSRPISRGDLGVFTERRFPRCSGAVKCPPDRGFLVAAMTTQRDWRSQVSAIH